MSKINVFVLLLAFKLRILAVGATRNTTSHDYCEGENAVFACNAGEVVLVQSAIYGRMTKGQCISFAIQGTMGCSEDITDMLDNICSGKQTCQFKVSYEDLDRSKNCHEELAKYLQASYNCLKASTPQKVCQDQSISLRTGINNIVKQHDMSDCTVNPATWTLSAQPGQQLAVKLVDFSWTHDAVSGCASRYGQLIDKLTNEHISVCGHGTKSKTIYQSQHNEFQFELAAVPDRFVLQVEVSGCPEVSLPGAYVKREGDQVTIGCKYEDKTWTLQCKESRWIGTIGNCTTQKTKDINPTVRSINLKVDQHNISRKSKAPQSAKLSEDLVILIVCCATLVLCLVVATTGFVCVRKYKTHTLAKYNRAPKEPDYALYEQGLTGEQFTATNTDTIGHQHNWTPLAKTDRNFSNIGQLI